MSRSIKDPIDTRDHLRLLWLLLLLLALFGLVIFSFYRLQITDRDKWLAEARRQHFFAIKEPFVRGSFISNDAIKKEPTARERRFVVDIEKFHLHVDPQSIPEEHKSTVASVLIDKLEMDSEEASTCHGQLIRKSRNRKLAAWLDKETRDAILNWWYPFAKQQGIARNALFFIADYQRSYPFGKLLGQVLHTTQRKKDESTQQSIPTGGLELQFDAYLKGHVGKRELMRSPKNAFELGEVLQAPSHGADIYLTINHHLQTIVEEELEKGVKKSSAKAGWAAMMDPHTGQILAIAQYPPFYPGDYQSYFNDSTSMVDTHMKAISYAYEPGSVIKPITLYAGLKANEELIAKGQAPLFDPEEVVATSNGRFAGRSQPLRDTSLHYYMNMSIALQKSANIYMARLAEKIVARMGAQWYRDLLHETFGFGTKTGVEFPCESTGMVPAIGKRYANGAMEWSAGTPLSLSIGYNLQINSIQLLAAYAMLVNGGYKVQPTLLRQIKKNGDNGEKIVLVDNTQCEREKNRVLKLKPAIAREVVKAMKYTTKPGGTASRADVPGYSEAGKTSTTKKIVNGSYSETLYRPSFIGFTPVENPAFVLYIIVDEPEYGFRSGIGKIHHGGLTAAPIFREIAKRSLAYLGIAPDDPYGYPNGDPRSDPAKADWRPEAQKLQEIYNKWNRSTPTLSR